MISLDFGPVGNSRNSFRCPYCKEVTSHFRVGYSEAPHWKNRSLGVRLLGRFCDDSGMTSLSGTICGYKYWKCAKCANVIARNTSGEIDFIRYSNFFKDEGYGLKEYKDGVYHGDFLIDERSGKGEMSFYCGDEYDGEWANDRKNGKGKYTWANGSYYEGEWKDGDMHGFGKRVYLDGRVYEGNWRDDKRYGHGICHMPNGDVYDGEWANDKMNGKGKYSWANGNYYEGEWKDGNMHGLGKHTWADGDFYEGEWKDGNMKNIALSDDKTEIIEQEDNSVNVDHIEEDVQRSTILSSMSDDEIFSNAINLINEINERRHNALRKTFVTHIHSTDINRQADEQIEEVEKEYIMPLVEKGNRAACVYYYNQLLKENPIRARLFLNKYKHEHNGDTLSEHPNIESILSLMTNH